ncbi:MAG: phosphodiesterase [Gammaproteobacteria bacterium]
MKLIHITDTHFVKPVSQLYGLAPYTRLAACIDDINSQHADADLCVITGGLAHWGDLEAYRALRDNLRALKIPLRLLVGKPDQRIAFTQIFPETPVDGHGFMQSTLQTPAGVCIFLDTVEAGAHSGRYCTRRQAWLRQELQYYRDQPVYLFMHHPPFRIGLKSMDQRALQDREALAELLQDQHSAIRHLFFGHTPRPISGSWCGIPFTTLRATSHQVWLDVSRKDILLGSQEPPAYAVALLDASHNVVQRHDYLDSRPTVERIKRQFPLPLSNTHLSGGYRHVR